MRRRLEPEMNKAMYLPRRFLLALCAGLALLPLLGRADADLPEAAVYAALFEHLAPEDGALRTAVLGTRAADRDEVFAAASSSESVEEVIRSGVPEASPALRAAFLGELKKASPLRAHELPARSALKFQLVPQQELDDLFQATPTSAAWDRFHRRFPQASSRMSLSRVVMDPATDTALVYVGSACGRLCGGGWLVFMTRQGGVWLVSREVQLWIA